MKERRWVGPLLLVIVALGVRLVAHSQMSAAEDTFSPRIDSEAYLVQALRVAAGKDISDTVYFQAPLYPWVLGATFRLVGVEGVSQARILAEVPEEIGEHAIGVGRALNLILGLFLVLQVWRLGSLLFDERTGFFSGLLAALYAPAVFYEGQLLKVTLSLVLVAWAMLAFLRAQRSKSLTGWLWVGVALGLGTLVRGNMMVVIGLGIMTFLVKGWRDGSWRALTPMAGMGVLGVAVALAPVAVRNSMVTGSLTLSTATPGTAFYLCNRASNEKGLLEHTPLNRQVPLYEEKDWRLEAERRTGEVLTAAQVSRYWFQQALVEIKNDPERYLFAEVRKLGLLFSSYEAPDNVYLPLAEERAPVLRGLPGYGLLFPLALAGLVLAGRKRWEGGRGLLLWTAGAYGASLLLFIVDSRFRMPIVVPLLPWAGFLLGSLDVAIPVKVRWKVAGAVLTGMFLGSVSETSWLGPLSPAEKMTHTATSLFNRAETALVQGDGESARRDLGRAIALSERFGRAAPLLYVKMGELEKIEGNRALARDWIEKAFELNPDHHAALRDAGLMAYEDGETEQAVEFFEQALARMPGDRISRLYLSLAHQELGNYGACEEQARLLITNEPHDDDGYGLLALALIGQNRWDAGREAVAQYDHWAAVRENSGQERFLPDQSVFAQLRPHP
ncbi:MAG: glycosyltransferase family 39 protein [Planctomycetota bacterium]|nr:glycosyltransferase family 39 protein [Planctomycetota bacterium]